MPNRCVAYGCGKFSGQNVSMFRFPKDPAEFRKWEKQVQKTRKKWVAKTYSHLCSEHFSKDCFDPKSYAAAKTMGFKGLRLKDGAVPTVFIRPPCSNCGGSGVSCSFCTKRRRGATTEPQRVASVSVPSWPSSFSTDSLNKPEAWYGGPNLLKINKYNNNWKTTKVWGQ